MAEGLEILRGVRLAALRPASGGLELGDEAGNTHGVVDAVVVTAPAPQAADLLACSPEPGERVALLRTLAYEPAVMVLAGVVLGGWSIGRAPHGQLAELRIESLKGRPAIDGVHPVVARLDPRTSADLLDASDDAARGGAAGAGRDPRPGGGRTGVG